MRTTKTPTEYLTSYLFIFMNKKILKRVDIILNNLAYINGLKRMKNSARNILAKISDIYE